MSGYLGVNLPLEFIIHVSNIFKTLCLELYILSVLPRFSEGRAVPMNHRNVTGIEYKGSCSS